MNVFVQAFHSDNPNLIQPKNKQGWPYDPTHCMKWVHLTWCLVSSLARSLASLGLMWPSNRAEVKIRDLQESTACSNPAYSQRRIERWFHAVLELGDRKGEGLPSKRSLNVLSTLWGWLSVHKMRYSITTIDSRAPLCPAQGVPLSSAPTMVCASGCRHAKGECLQLVGTSYDNISAGSPTCGSSKQLHSRVNIIGSKTIHKPL